MTRIIKWFGHFLYSTSLKNKIRLLKLRSFYRYQKTYSVFDFCRFIVENMYQIHLIFTIRKYLVLTCPPYSWGTPSVLLTS